MKELLHWLKEAGAMLMRALLTLLVLVLAGIGIGTSVNFALEVNAEHCASVTKHVSLCLVDDRKAMKEEPTGYSL